jgi:regulator of RNase E activity RraB
LTLAALALLTTMAESAEPAPLDEDFLEYLSEFESESDNWTLFVDEEATDDQDDADKDEKPAKPVKPVKDVKK